MAHPGGRPTSYNSDFNGRVWDYLETTGREQTILPTVEGFAIYLGVSRDSLYEWAKVYPEFSDTLKTILEYQKVQLMNDGMYGGKEVSPAVAIFLMKVNHDMIEKSAVDVTSAGKPIPILGGLSVHKDDSASEDKPA